jgi:hypothetical protein
VNVTRGLSRPSKEYDSMRNYAGMENPVVNAYRKVWLAGLGAAVVTRDWAQAEAPAVFRNLVKEGTLV